MSLESRLKKLELIQAIEDNNLKLFFQNEEGLYEHARKIYTYAEIEQTKGIKLILIDDYGDDEA